MVWHRRGFSKEPTDIKVFNGEAALGKSGDGKRCKSDRVNITFMTGKLTAR